MTKGSWSECEVTVIDTFDSVVAQMPRMTIFRQPGDVKVGINTYNVRRVRSTPDLNVCRVVFGAQHDGDFVEDTLVVLGTFDAIISALECDN